jgi:hypothetical protein
MQLARTQTCGSGSLAAQNGVLHCVFFKIVKHLQVFCPRVFFMIPCIIFRNVEGTLNLYHPYVFIPDHFEFLVQDVYWFHSEIPFMIHLDHIPINYVVRIMHIFL